MNIKYKNVLVYGASLSGEWASKLLLKYKANVFLYDDFCNLKSRVINGIYILEELNSNLISQFDFIIVSPSIEEDNKFLQIAKDLNIRIYSELEFASLFCKKYVAITGTNGKTTTTELTAKILGKKFKSVACGNNGYPVSKAVLNNKKCLKVIEVSSFMLENAKCFKPQVATVLNVTPDHLIRHKTIEKYKELKISIFKNLSTYNYAVINLDNKIKPQINCKIITYSFNKHADVHIKNNYIYLRDNRFMAVNQVPIKGKHNLYNVMCAICFGLIYKVKPSKIKQAILEYKAESYRIEHVAKVNGIDFINDSKSTNISSTLASVDTIKGSIILLLGGSNKALNYEDLFNKMSKRVKNIIAYGEIAETLNKANNLKFKMQMCVNLNDAFDVAIKLAKTNDTILLSPASASYDQFTNYIERGKAFNSKVLEYENSFKKK